MVGRQSHHASLTQEKRDLKMEKIRSPNDVWKGYLKTWDWWNSQSFQKHCPWTSQGGAYSIPCEPPVAMANVLIDIGLWPTAIKLNASWKKEVSKNAWIKPSMAYLSNDHDDWANQYKNSHKLCNELGHPVVNLMESQWKLRQKHDQNFPMEGKPL